MAQRTRPSLNDLQRKPSNDASTYAISLIYQVCCIAGSTSLLEDISADSELTAAIKHHDTAKLYDWLMEAFHFQGISDQVALNYLEKHGRARWHALNASLKKKPPCPKLKSYWHFHGCRYDKIRQTCACPQHFRRCPLPKLPLRNGRLNRTAFSLYFFIRDIADGDFVAWVDQRLKSSAKTPIGALRAALLEPLRSIFGISDKVVAMSLAGLLLAAPKSRRAWHTVGAHFVTIDTLVHNFLHRTGILKRFNAEHSYGPVCYGLGGCADILEFVSAHIDAGRFNPAFPKNFPRFVQHAVWQFCSQSAQNVCNGNRLDDRSRCKNVS